jgi:hypothetical protein
MKLENVTIEADENFASSIQSIPMIVINKKTERKSSAKSLGKLLVHVSEKSQIEEPESGETKRPDIKNLVFPQPEPSQNDLEDEEFQELASRVFSNSALDDPTDIRIDLEELKNNEDNEDFYTSENSYLIEEKPENEEKSTVKAGKSSIGDQSLQKDIQNEVILIIKIVG